MKYLLVENKQIVHLGPMFWNHRMFQSELEDLDVSFKLSPSEPGALLRINDDLEIYPLEDISYPEYDSMFEQLVGPFWNFGQYYANGTFDKTDIDTNAVKSKLKELAAAERWKKESTPFKMTIQDVEVSVDASRDNRNIFVQKYQFMADGETVDWKFPEAWLTLTKAELGSVVLAGAAHIQAQFDWEKNLVDQIDAAVDNAELKVIYENNLKTDVAPGVV